MDLPKYTQPESYFNESVNIKQLALLLIQQFFSNNQRYHLQHWSRDRAKLTDVCLLNYFDLVHLLVNLWEL
jgi:hypothetical protein